MSDAVTRPVSSIARLHIAGIADERHYHNDLEQKISKLEARLAGLRAEWDEFIAAQLELQAHIDAEPDE